MVIRKRSSSGCLLCKKRKKKCDEIKPTCSACRRNFLECAWPDSSKKEKSKNKDTPPTRSESVEFNITLMKLKHRIKYAKNDDLRMEIYVKRGSNKLYQLKNTKLERIKKFPRALPVLPNDIDSPFIKYHEKHIPNDDFWNSTAPLDLELRDFLFVDLADGLSIPPYELENPTEEQEKRYLEILQKYNNNSIPDDTYFNDVDLESFIFYTSLTGFIPKIGTQHTSPDLTVGATFVPFVSSNPIMKQVFLCCGATYLAWHDFERFQKYSDDYYLASKNLLQEYMETNKQFYKEDWVFASLLLLVIRVKNAFYGTVDDSVGLLAYSYDLISRRYFDYHAINPHERMFVESFIYHYSTSVLYAQDISRLPSPFVIFKELNKALSCPVYNCENVVEWMKNPVLGSCLDTFEIIAKLSYIARMPMPLAKNWLLKVVQLRNLCIQYQHPIPDQRMTDIEWYNFRINSMVGLLTVKVCYLLASKMIDFYTFDPYSSSVRDCVKEILRHFKEIPEKHQIWGILPWTMLVSGCFCTEPEDQHFILQRINQMTEVAHSYVGVKMAKFLHDVWGDTKTDINVIGDVQNNKSIDRKMENQGVNNINYLFDRKRLLHVDM